MQILQFTKDDCSDFLKIALPHIFALFSFLLVTIDNIRALENCHFYDALYVHSFKQTHIFHRENIILSVSLDLTQYDSL